jgi:GMP synthase-like glutamine amidotransferase
MYLYVVVQEKESYYKDGPNGRVKVRLEQASHQRCLVVPYQEFNPAVVWELRPRAVAFSGFGRHFQDRKIEWFFGIDEVLRGCELPMLCFCGSHQLLGFCFNGDIRRRKVLRDQPMRKLKPGDPAPRRPAGDGSDLSGYFVADGFVPIRRVRNDPLFAGLPKLMTMRCAHYCQVRKLPPGFELLASSDHCRIEAMRHRRRVLYGTQFHPEAYEPPFFHGRKLLENFAAIVERYWSRAVPGATGGNTPRVI